MKTNSKARQVAVAVVALAALATAAIATRDDDSVAAGEKLGPPPTAWPEQAQRERPPGKGWVKLGEVEVPAGATPEGLPSRRFVDREARVALTVARAFLAGYLDVEAGQGGKAARELVRATATSGLAGELLAADPRPAGASGRPPRAQVDAAELEFDKPPTTAMVRAEVRRGDDRSDIALILDRDLRGKWTVVDITE